MLPPCLINIRKVDLTVPPQLSILRLVPPLSAVRACMPSPEFRFINGQTEFDKLTCVFKFITDGDEDVKIQATRELV